MSPTRTHTPVAMQTAPNIRLRLPRVAMVQLSITLAPAALKHGENYNLGLAELLVNSPKVHRHASRT